MNDIEMHFVLFFVLSFSILGIVIFIAYRLSKIEETLSRFPIYILRIDISRRRQPNYEIEILKALHDVEYGDLYISYKKMRDWGRWASNCVMSMRSPMYKKFALSVLKDVLNFDEAFHVEVFRRQTRYHQTNYVRTPYVVNMVEYEECMSYDEIVELWECAHSDVNIVTPEFVREQRRLMTPELREQIMIRDDYTCQCCGKEMFDEVGLHIDHIVPVSKGGRTVPSNLQVLCSKCNGSKGNKLDV